MFLTAKDAETHQTKLKLFCLNWGYNWNDSPRNFAVPST